MLLFNVNDVTSYQFSIRIGWEAKACDLLPPASEGWGKVMFSVCSHLGGGGLGQSADGGGGGQVQPGGGGQVSQPTEGGGGQVSQPTGGGGVRSSRGRGGQSAGWGGGVSILRPLAGDMPLASTQEDFLVYTKLGFGLSLKQTDMDKGN